MKKMSSSFVLTMQRLSLAGILAVLLSTFSVSATIAAVSTDLNTIGTAAGYDTSATNTLSVKVANAVNTALGLVGFIFLILVVYGGFKIMFSQGQEESISKGRDSILYGVIGIVVVASAYALAQFIVERL